MTDMIHMETILSQDKTPIAYQRGGSGPPLLLVHGAVADSTRWAPVLPLLEAHFTVYAMNRRGRGGSGDTHEYAIQREFEDIAALVDAINEPVNLLGHSFGAFCSLEASLLTSHVNRLILYEPPPPGIKGTLSSEVAATLQALLDAGDREGVIRTFLLKVAQVPPAELELLRSLPAWAGRVAAAHTILREIIALEQLPLFDPARFKTFKIPTLLLLGGDSPPLYREIIEQIHSALANSTTVILPGQQHVAMNTAPDLFVGEVLAFLTESP
ncbi:MAG: alpha/beta hydrolase [Anaerolineae bacterium]|nr:alpha/beta hydrolase [Anaerolineae bacterium]